MLRLDYNQRPFSGVEPQSEDHPSLREIKGDIAQICALDPKRILLVKGSAEKNYKTIGKEFHLAGLFRFFDSASRWRGEKPDPQDMLYLHWHLRDWDPAFKESGHWRICDSLDLCGVGGFSLILLPEQVHWEGEPLSPLYLPVIGEALKQMQPFPGDPQVNRDYMISMLVTEVPEVSLYGLDQSLPNSFMVRLPGVAPEILLDKMRMAGIALGISDEILSLSLNPHWELEQIDRALGEVVPVFKSLVTEELRLAPPEFALSDISSGCGGCCKTEGKKECGSCGQGKSCGKKASSQT